MSASAPPLPRFRGPDAARPLRYRDFRVLMLATVMGNLVIPMQWITLTFWAIDTYPNQDVLFSGLIMAVRGVGLLIFSLVGGVIADRFERRIVLRGTEIVAFSATALLAVCMLTEPFGPATFAAVLVLVFVSAGNMAVDLPARTASIPVLVPAEDMGRAIGLNNIAQAIAFPVILPLVGFLAQVIGPGAVVACSLLAWAVIFPLVFSLNYTTRGGPALRREGTVITDIRQGIGYARRNATIFAVIGMVVTLQVFAMPGVGMLGPVWMTEVLDLSRTGFGFIAMLWGIGAAAGSITFAFLTRYTRRGTTLAVLVIVFALAAITFGHSRIIPVTAAMNFCLGFTLSASLVTAMTLVQYNAAEELRGRLMSLFPLIMGLSMLNVGPVSAAGQALGLEVIVPVMSYTAFALAALIIAIAPALRHGGSGRLAREPLAAAGESASPGPVAASGG